MSETELKMRFNCFTYDNHTHTHTEGKGTETGLKMGLNCLSQGGLRLVRCLRLN